MDRGKHWGCYLHIMFITEFRNWALRTVSLGSNPGPQIGREHSLPLHWPVCLPSDRPAHCLPLHWPILPFCFLGASTCCGLSLLRIIPDQTHEALKPHRIPWGAGRGQHLSPHCKHSVVPVRTYSCSPSYTRSPPILSSSLPTTPGPSQPSSLPSWWGSHSYVLDSFPKLTKIEEPLDRTTTPSPRKFGIAAQVSKQAVLSQG